MNICTGDFVRWNAPQFSGGSFFRGRSTGKPRFTGYIERAGTVERESYGEKTGQHTFSIRMADGTIKRVKGRNLYPNVLEHRESESHDTAAADKAGRAASQSASARRDFRASPCNTGDYLTE